MSRAFVREDGAERWTPPTPSRAYRLVWTGPQGPETVHETDDLVLALHWLRERDRPGFELRDHFGTLLALLAA
ncbi:hypothetical protein [Deinococcus hopiensis]|uniref:Uncharacterized protein n=1 Tax=Deinococcus hopiensis KR-140 TaxID=695939 RepID=A0A1W1VQQ2_9DEIO|nr:hypothetical protein [Deinococcus hopiensis]SMB95695.1 hypothetical protein SAMN00790413_02948 [Deinococcus hopiensis KR-140]